MTKRIYALLLVVCLVITSSQYIYAENNNVNKIDVLTKLEILKGNGVSLDLDSKLSRAEAAAFIVRLLGEENEVKENKGKYNHTGFSDVRYSEWFAPYIGYCAQNGIINGYKDDTFKPKDTLGEKAFLKLILTAMGYEYNVDFTWNNVFGTAYGIGLVQDLSYSSGHEEDKNFTRGEVADFIYRSLQMNHNKTKVRMIQKFVDKGIISKAEAIDYNLLEDEIFTEIVSVTPTDSTTIEIKFNEPIQPITPENLLIYESSGTSNVLSFESVTKKDSADTYILKTAQEQKRDEEYTILVDKVIDTFGNPSNTLSKNFIGYRPDEIVSDLFEVSKVEAISNNVIYVYFTQPINDNALQTAFYTINKDDTEYIKGNNMNIMINKLSTCDNGISIFFKNHIFETEEYFKLAVDGMLSSIYGVRLNDGEGDTINFKSSIKSNDPFMVESCLPINNRTIQLVFNKEVNPVRAEQIFSYYVTDYNNQPIKIDKAEVINEGSNAGRVVRLTINTSIIINKEYKVLINDMTDITRQFSIVEKQYSFNGGYYSVENIDIEAILPLDESTIVVYVNKALDNDAAKMLGNYQVQGVTTSGYIAVPTAIYYDNTKEAHQIKLYFGNNVKFKQSQTYKLRVISFKDTLGNTQNVIKTKQFNFTTSNSPDIFITEAKVIGNNTIKLSFNKEIDYNIDNVQASNYKLTYLDNGVEYSKIPIGANYIDPSTIILNFDLLDNEKEYKLTFKKLVDYGKNVTENKDGKYIVDVLHGK